MAAKIMNEVKTIAKKRCKNSAYGSSFLDGLNKMRVDQKYCDFTLEANGKIFKVHKVALAIGSPYFAKMLETDMEEKRAGTVKLEEVDVCTVEALIQYVYTGIIILTKDNVEALLSASDRFQIEWVKLECEKYVKRNLNPANCFRILRLGDTPSFTSLYDPAHNYIVDQFDDLIEVEDFLLLSFDEIKKLIKDDQLAADNVYNAVLKWVKYDRNKRKVHLAELMSHITLPLLSTQFLKSQVSAEPLLTEDRTCNKLLMNALFHKLTSIEEGKPLPDSLRTRKRPKHIVTSFLRRSISSQSRILWGNMLMGMLSLGWLPSQSQLRLA
ncbi:kelch-like protein 2 [Glossina fuscipes]|uniref:Kelch-like protein 2 n=1 Tax=Glossina fuscipes TaxID=7396 RepID=A0A9C6DVZ5_9MUSC|nr:kelch-like protein 2 [Glossina fuscipes]